jgi:hypothetical protein
MRLNRPPGVATNPEPAGGHRVAAGVVRTLSVAAVAAAACALSALPAMAASSAPAAGTVATTTTITNPANDVWVHADGGVAVPLTATVTAADGTTPTGTIEFIPQPPVTPYAAIECSVALNAEGTGTCDVTPPAGTWGFILYEATYTPTAGSEWTTSTSTGEHKVITWDITATSLAFAPSPATVGKPDTLTATVTDEPKDNLSGAGGGADQVTFSADGTAIPGCSDVNVTDPSDGPDNVATCTYTPAATGSVSIEAAYLGDDYALPSSATETLTVDKGSLVASKTTVSVSPKTADEHQAVKLSVAVTASGTTPTGTVTLWVSTRELCAGTLSGGKYSCEAGFPNPGGKTIVAKYSGSSTVEASSGTAALTIDK